MTKSSAVKNVSWIGVVWGVGLIAMSAPALAISAAASAGQQVAQQQQQQVPYIPPGQPKPAPGKPQQQQNQQHLQQQVKPKKPQEQQVNPQQHNNNQQNNQHNYATQNNNKTKTQSGNQNNNQNNKNNQSNNNQNNNKNNDQHGGRYDWSSYQPGHRPPQWQQYHQNFDPRPYQWNRNAERHYHWQPYNQPSGWHYQRWTYGQVLPNPFWVRGYWIESYWNFGLPDPPYGYVWVRYGDDALLVDVESGQILSAEYGLFA